MNKSSNSLLALLLTLPDLTQPLTTDERESLQNVGDQLDIDPDAWESDIEPELLEIVQANPTLHQQFTATQAKLDSLGDNIWDLLPSQEEVDLVFPPKKKSGKRGLPKGQPDNSTYIKNFSVSILTNPDPQSASKKCKKEGLLNKIIQKLGRKG